VTGSFNDQGELEISDGRLMFFTGKKKSGKSVMAKLIFFTYPGDRVIIDIAGDDGPTGPEVIELVGDHDTLPAHWPAHLRRYDDNGRPKPMTLRYVPDPGSPTLAQDMDHVIGLSLAHSRSLKDRGKMGVLVLVHEIGVLTPANRTQPNMRRALMHNRHQHLTMLMCGPRPKDIDPLVLQQADLIYIFELMNKYDRQRLAEAIGWEPKDIDAAMTEVQVHEYLRFDANELKPAAGEEDLRILHMPPLPEDVVREVSGPLPPAKYQRQEISTGVHAGA
jgi:hypothetical protein